MVYPTESIPNNINIPFEEITLIYKNKRIPAWIVLAPSLGNIDKSVVLFHGFGGAVSDWKKVQCNFYENNISSLAFNYADPADTSIYSNHESTSLISDVRQITAIAIDSLKNRLSRNKKIYLCAHSLGNGVMLDSYKYINKANIEALIMCNPCSSIKDWITYKKYFPKIFKPLIIFNFYDNKKLIKNVHQPVLWVHSKADQTTPVWMGQKIYKKIPTSKQYILFETFNHNYLLEGKEDYWSKIIDYINEEDFVNKTIYKTAIE
ncbi:MAG: alpha/beta hydrolase [Bacteroidota bacterium]